MKQHSLQKNESALKACVVLPTYNEVENIESIIKAIFAMQSNVATHQLYVIVVDDNSPDGTQEIVKKQMQKTLALQLSREPQYCAIFGIFLSDILKLYSTISKISL